MPDVPHFAFPFSLTSTGHVAVVDQDSPNDVAGCVAAICSYRLGDRADAPTFGIEAQDFRTGGPNPLEIRTAIAAWEDRAEATLDLDDDDLVKGISDVTVFLGAGGNQ